MQTGKTPGRRAALSHQAWTWDCKGPYTLTHVPWEYAAPLCALPRCRLLTLPEAVMFSCFSQNNVHLIHMEKKKNLKRGFSAKNVP